MKSISITILIALWFSGIVEARNPKAVFDTLVKVAAGAGAAMAVAESAEAHEVHASKDRILADLIEKGVDPTNSAIFQLYFRIDPSSAGRWFLKPNVYALVQIEGQGDFIPASIAKGYKGQAYTVTVFGRQVRPGGRILVHLLDDKQFWNNAWNSVLQTEVPVSVGGQYLTPMLRANATASAGIQLLNKDITFQPPGYMATADITVPSSSDGIWLADGRLMAGSTQVGVMQFGQVWIPDSGLLQEKRSSKKAMIFWGGLAIVLVVVFISLFNKGSDAAENLEQSGEFAEFTFNCNHCTQSISTTSNMIGQTARCPTCNSSIVVSAYPTSNA